MKSLLSSFLPRSWLFATAFLVCIHATLLASERPAITPFPEKTAREVPADLMEKVYQEVKTHFKFGVVLEGEPGEMLDCPNIFRHEGRWYMMYVCIRDQVGYETHLASSTDLLHWTKLGRILPHRKEGWDAWQADGGLALYDTRWEGGDHALSTHEGRYWLSYIGGAKQGYEPDPLSIGLASSESPTKVGEWKRLESNPILSPRDKDVRPFENVTLYKSAIIRDESRSLGWPFVMFYNGKTVQGNHESIGMAVSEDLRHWVRYGDSPVVDNEPGKAAISGDPQIVRIGDLWVMFYFGFRWKPGAFDTFACSYDLVHWTKWNGPHLVEPSESYDKPFSHKPWLLKHEGVVYHFYCAVGDRGRVIALATSKDLTGSQPAAAIGKLSSYDLRCDWMENPRGVDSLSPRLSWKLRSTESQAIQSAWQVRAASSMEALTQDKPDLWDSGKQLSPKQFGISYAGKPLKSGQTVFWQTRVWDAQGKASAWSRASSWTMGLVDKDKWTAPWISDSSLLEGTRRHLGFSTPPTNQELTPHWLWMDLGKEVSIDQIVLHALTHTVPERLGFPRWYKLEIACGEDFRDAQVLADKTQDPSNIWFSKLTIQGEGKKARYLRLSVPRLRMVAEEEYSEPMGRLALSQIEVRSGTQNVALGAQLRASASLEEGPWALSSLVDGLGVPASNPRACDSLRLRREFRLRGEIKTASLEICGLGHYTLHLNGTEVGASNYLKPAWTDYTKAAQYDSYDVTQLLNGGPNALGITLAGGMYNVQALPGRYTKFVGPPRTLMASLRLTVEYKDGSQDCITTDSNWLVGKSPITFSQVYGGEDYDARLEQAGWDRPGFDDSAWSKATLTPMPVQTLRGASLAAPPIAKTYDVFTSKKTTVLRPGVEVHDLGQNASIIPRLRVRGNAGAAIKIMPAELANPDGSIDRSSLGAGSNASYWKYTLRGDPAGEEWFPSFFYHGCRYLQVEKIPAADGTLPELELLEGCVVQSASEAVGRFSCSNPLFNRIHRMVRWAQRSNMVHVLTDCPHRERFGWLEQYHLNGPSLRYEFDLTRLYAKVFQDIRDSQRSNGLITSVSPEYVRFDGDFRDSPEWGSTLILAAWQQYVWTGDEQPLRSHFSAMRRYFQYLEGKATDHILSHGLGDWYDQGPNRPGMPQLTPVALPATAIFYEDAKALAKIARILGEPTLALEYEAKAGLIRQSFNRHFFKPAENLYATGSQTAQAMPYVLGLVPEEHRAGVFQKLIDAVRNKDNSVTAGDVGYRYLLLALSQGAQDQLIFDMNNQSARPGYGFLLAQGATALPEAWDGNKYSSQNHFMLGQILEWFYADLAGLAPDPEHPGFGNILVRPNPVGDITWAEASHNSVRGMIRVRWERNAERFLLKLEVPPNATATICFPHHGKDELSCVKGDLKQIPGLVEIPADGGRRSLRVASGQYEFVVR